MIDAWSRSGNLVRNDTKQTTKRPCMSWHYLQAVAAVSSEDLFSVGEPSARLKSMLIAEAVSSPDSATASCHGFQSGTMLPLSEPIIWSAPACSPCSARSDRSWSLPEDSHARTLVQPELALGLTEIEADYGAKCAESSVRFDRATCLWKIPQSYGNEVLRESSVDLPAWGTMRDGVVSELMIPSWKLSHQATYTAAKGFFCLPTPEASQGGRQSGSFNQTSWMKEDGSPKHFSLAQKIKILPTPLATSEKQGKIQPDGRSESLIGAIVRLPTPIAGDASGSRGSKGKDRPDEGGLAMALKVWSTPRAPSVSGGGIGLDGGAGARKSATPPELRTGQLNPDWVEWFMGWPPCWTSLEPLDRATFNAWRETMASHGAWWNEEPANIPRLASKVKHRIARCRAIGNGQVPATVAIAWETLTAP